MSNLGLMLLYGILNDQPDMLAERVFSPWLDMEEVMRREGIPLYSLETKHPIRDFDLLGISLPYEQLYTNAVNMLNLAGLPILAEERDESYPPVIAGGHSIRSPAASSVLSRLLLTPTHDPAQLLGRSRKRSRR